MLRDYILKSMRRLLFLISALLFFNSLVTGQEQTTYTARTGSKFFPGHNDIVITIDNNIIRYEVFNHWYTGSYAELRQMKINSDSLDFFNKNDTIQIKIRDNKITLIDKKYGINKRLKHIKLCASPEKMKKISFAYKISAAYGNVSHYELYTQDDLNLLSQIEFEAKVIENMEKIKNTSTDKRYE